MSGQPQRYVLSSALPNILFSLRIFVKSIASIIDSGNQLPFPSLGVIFLCLSVQQLFVILVHGSLECKGGKTVNYLSKTDLSSF